SALMNGTITNFTANQNRRVDLQFGIGAGQDLATAHKTLLALVESDSRALTKPPPAVANVKLIDGGTQIELRVWCRTAQHGDLMSDLVAHAPGALAKAGIKGPDKAVYFVERKPS